MNDHPKSPSVALSDVLSAASARNDQWRQLNATARAWSGQSDGARAAKLRADCADLLGDLSRLEYCWAYPGPRLLEAVRTSLDVGDAGTFSRLVQKVSAGLLSGDYRRQESTWDPGASDLDDTVFDTAPSEEAPTKQYFEVLIVTPNDPAGWQRTADEMRRLRRVDDPFAYAVVHVGSFEDAALAVVVNASLQAVVLMDGFSYESQHDLQDIDKFLARFAPSEDRNTLEPGTMSTALARAIHSARPELDLYLLSDRAPEQLAGSPDAACIRRVFHHIEEPIDRKSVV